MGDYMQDKNPKFFQQNIRANNDSSDSYLLLIEIEDNIPIASYIVKIPESYKYYFKAFPYYPEIVN